MKEWELKVNATGSKVRLLSYGNGIVSLCVNDNWNSTEVMLSSLQRKLLIEALLNIDGK